MDSGSERSGVFGVACSNTAPPFEKKESIFNEMTEFVEIFAVFPQMFSVLSWWNDRRHVLVNSLEDNRVCIIAPVCQKVLCPESRNQLRCNCAIRCGTRTDKESHRHTMRIHLQRPHHRGAPGEINKEAPRPERTGGSFFFWGSYYQPCWQAPLYALAKICRPSGLTAYRMAITQTPQTGDGLPVYRRRNTARRRETSDAP